MTINKILAQLENQKAKSAWNRGVNTYAQELIEQLKENIDGGYMIESDILSTRKALINAMLNGAKDWKQYSWGGCSLCCNYQIAERLCTASELKRTHNGARKPNKTEEWLDTQARALYQAATLIIKAAEL